MLYSEKGEALGPSTLRGCASPMDAPQESKDGGELQHPGLHQGLGNVTAMLRFLWQSREVQDEIHAGDSEEEKPPLILTLCPVRALHRWVWARGCSVGPPPTQPHPTSELSLSCTQKDTPAIAALFFI